MWGRKKGTLLAEEPETFGWVTVDEAAIIWRQLGDLDEDAVPIFLNAAHTECVAFLNGKDPAPDDAPDNYKLAQVMQARDLARALSVSDGSLVGPDGEQVTLYPMDWTVKHLLRPKRARRYVR